MADSRAYVLKGKSGVCSTQVILADGFDVFLATDSVKGRLLPHAVHTCCDPRSPKFGDKLYIGDFGPCRNKSHTTARYMTKKGLPGFYYRGIGPDSPDDWEAVDHGPIESKILKSNKSKKR